MLVAVAVAPANAAPLWTSPTSLSFFVPPACGLDYAGAPLVTGPAPGGLSLMGARFFEPDEGLPVPVTLLPSEDPGYDAVLARIAMGAALTVWSRVSGSRLVLVDSGGSTRVHSGGINVSFTAHGVRTRFDCRILSGVSFGGPGYDEEEDKVIAGRRYFRTLAGDAAIVIEPWPTGCTAIDFCIPAEVAVHEIGHAIGLGHPLMQEADDATMRGSPHADCRCAGIRAPDATGLAYVYPTAQPVTITSPARLPVATLQGPYTFQLQAIGGTGGYVWELRQSEFNIPYGLPPGMTFDGTGLISGTPTEFGLQFGNWPILVRATDANGDRHTKRIVLPVRYAFETTTTSTTTTTVTLPVVEPDTISCFATTSTSTTIPPPCGEQPTDAYERVTCRLVEAVSAGVELGPPGRKPVRVLQSMRNPVVRLRLLADGRHPKRMASIARRLRDRSNTVVVMANRRRLIERAGSEKTLVFQQTATVLDREIAALLAALPVSVR